MKKFLVCLALGAAIGVAYSNILSGEFVFDDYLLVVSNPALPKVAARPWLAIFPSILGYRPFRTLSYVLDYRLAGMTPWVFHVSNILYHWITACLVFLVTLRLTKDVDSPSLGNEDALAVRGWRTAFFVACIWALHPVQTDSVSYIAGRRDVIGGLCLFLAFWAYLRFREAQPDNIWRSGWLLLSCGVYGLGILSKESVLVLPALCWFYDVFREGFWESLRRRWGLYFFVLLCGVAVLWYFAGAMLLKTVLNSSWHGGSLQGNFATVARIWTHYLSVLIFPRTLQADYSYDAFPVSHSFFEPEVLAALSILGIVASVACLLGRRRPLIGYGALWMVIAILPVSHLIPIKELVAEHYLYVPAFGFALIGGVLLDAACSPKSTAATWAGRPIVVYGVVICLLVLAGFRIRWRNQDWANEETLWTRTAQTAPRCVRAHYNLAGVFLRQQRVEEAEQEFTKVLALAPTHVDALAGFGEIAFQKRQYGRALAYALQAQTINARSFRVQYLLGWVKLALKNLDEAERHFKQAMALNPKAAMTYTGLKAVAQARGEAEAQAREARE
jgi:hypothetical protein